MRDRIFDVAFSSGDGLSFRPRALDSDRTTLRLFGAGRGAVPDDRSCQSKPPRFGLAGLNGGRAQQIIVAHDFRLSQSDEHSLRRGCAVHADRVHLLDLRRRPPATDDLQGLDDSFGNERVLLVALLSRAAYLPLFLTLARSVKRAAIGRADLFIGGPFRARHASDAIATLVNSDYVEQDAIADCFFSHLGVAVPYSVKVQTSGGELKIVDTRPWWQLAGRLRAGEMRVLPAGEVAYTGEQITGCFTADGALLVSPQAPSAAALASRIHRRTSAAWQPVSLHVRDGRVRDIDGEGATRDLLCRLVDKDSRYSEITEIGISFNKACPDFVRDWNAPSNESRPGVHVAIGGDPDPPGGKSPGPPLVHIDLMAANCDVHVNGAPFLRATN